MDEERDFPFVICHFSFVISDNLTTELNMRPWGRTNGHEKLVLKRSLT